MNPLIGSTTQETVQHASEALEALMALLGQIPAHANLYRLLLPISEALEHAAE